MLPNIPQWSYDFRLINFWQNLSARDACHCTSRELSYITKENTMPMPYGTGALTTPLISRTRISHMINSTYPPPATVPVRRHSFITDVYCGAVRGDFEENMGAPGYVTQAALGFVPVVGQVCAVRDFIATRRKRDRTGMLLNVLVFIPFVGGFFKTILAIRNLSHVPKAMRRTGP